MIPTVRGHSGIEMPILGQGTWKMGERPERRAEEIESLRLGLELGMTLVDTAEMYADGGAEDVVGRAIRGRRHEVFVVSKVLPHNASLQGTIRAAERSLCRLGTEWIDLYLLHWPGRHPLEETFEAFELLERQGKIRYFGVSNFDHHEMDSAVGLTQGKKLVANQVLYNLERRAIERGIIPWCRRHEILVMAYSPLEQGRLDRGTTLREIAERHGATPAQIALVWTLRHDNVVAIPKAGRPEHVRENAGALAFTLTDEDLDELDRAYEPPSRDTKLETL
jgi:diketogulonate reductase-like aldo/keto reductase